VKAAVYMRVSTASQDTVNQRAACLEICARNGWEAIIIDETASGKHLRRAGWDRVLALAISREIGAVVVWAIDRIGRSMQEVFASVKSLDDAGIRLLSVREPWTDVGSMPGGADLMRNLLLAIFAWAAEFERFRNIERSKAGTDQARMAGRIGGRPRNALVGDGLAVAVALKNAGWSTVKIQRELFARGFHKPTCDCVGCRPDLADLNKGRGGKPTPLPRSTIHYAVARVTTFDNMAPGQQAEVAKP